MPNKLNAFIAGHKIASAIIFVALAGGGYYFYARTGADVPGTRYMLAAVEKGTVVASISGSGQVSSRDLLDLKPKASGDIISVKVSNGQEVKAGDVLAQLDAREALKAVRDAETNLASAKLSLEKLTQPADSLSLLQAENSFAQAKESKQGAQSDLAKAYEDAFTDVAAAFLDLPATMGGLEDILYKNTINTSQWNLDAYTDAVRAYDERILQYRSDALANAQDARKLFDKNFQSYKAATRNSDTAVIEALLAETYETSKSLAEAVKTANNLIDFVSDILTVRNLKVPTQAAGHKANLSNYTETLNSHIQTLLNRQQSIKNAKDAIINTDRTIAESSGSLAKLKAGTDALDIQSQQLTIRQRQNTLQDAREKLADYTVRAPFDGVMAKVNSKKGDAVTTATVLATLIAKQKIAGISLNEVDVAKVHPGLRATLTFDAVENLSMTGEVVDVDAIGTVTQGVVNYAVTIAFDTEDERVKPGMSVSAAVITQARQNVLIVQNSAVKNQGDAHYVEVLPAAAVKAASAESSGDGIPYAQGAERVMVEVGISNDTETEITGGLKEGDMVVVRTINGAAVSTAAQPQNQGFRLPGIGGGGTFRTQVR